MRHSLFQRCVLALIVSWLIATVTFWCIHALPGDLALQIAASRYSASPPDVLLADEVRAHYGLDRPLIVQYVQWLGRLATLDFGHSLVTGRPVLDEARSHVQNTIVLGGLSLTGAALIAFPLAYLAASRPAGTIDRLCLVYSSLFAAVPAFLMGIILINFFIVGNRFGALSGETGLSRSVLPAAVAAIAISAPLLKVIRDSVLRESRAIHLQFARMRGVPDRQVFLRHGLRNAALPVLGYMSTLFVYLAYDIVVIEVVFNYPGIGHALYEAIKARDIPTVQFAVLFLAIGYLSLTTIVDFAAEVLDPRIVLGGRR